MWLQWDATDVGDTVDSALDQLEWYSLRVNQTLASTHNSK